MNAKKTLSYNVAADGDEQTILAAINCRFSDFCGNFSAAEIERNLRRQIHHAAYCQALEKVQGGPKPWNPEEEYDPAETARQHAGATALAQAVTEKVMDLHRAEWEVQIVKGIDGPTAEMWAKWPPEYVWHTVDQEGSGMVYKDGATPIMVWDRSGSFWTSKAGGIYTRQIWPEHAVDWQNSLSRRP